MTCILALGSSQPQLAILLITGGSRGTPHPQGRYRHGLHRRLVEVNLSPPNNLSNLLLEVGLQGLPLLVLLVLFIAYLGRSDRPIQLLASVVGLIGAGGF